MFSSKFNRREFYRNGVRTGPATRRSEGSSLWTGAGYTDVQVLRLLRTIGVTAHALYGWCVRHRSAPRPRQGSCRPAFRLTAHPIPPTIPARSACLIERASSGTPGRPTARGSLFSEVRRCEVEERPARFRGPCGGGKELLCFSSSRAQRQPLVQRPRVSPTEPPSRLIR